MKLTNELIIGLMSGAIIGSAAGLVLAPRRGEETRGILKEQTAKIKDRIVNRGALTE
jgi:gas vesicle protein